MAPRIGKKLRTVAAAALMTGALAMAGHEYDKYARDAREYQKMRTELALVGHPFANTGVEGLLRGLHTGQAKSAVQRFEAMAKKDPLLSLHIGLGEMRREIDYTKNFIAELDSGKYPQLSDRKFLRNELVTALGIYEQMLTSGENVYNKRKAEMQK
ncbi:MAG: hypothetical protein NUV67_00475 [archaeon]|nr:hypothetical protein [archaeon]